MDSYLILFCTLFLFLVLLLAAPALGRQSHVSARLYSLIRAYQRIETAGRNKQWEFAIQSIAPYLNRWGWGVNQLDRLIRLSGTTGKSAAEMIIRYILSVGLILFLLFVVLGIENARVQAAIVAFSYPILGVRRLVAKKNRRQLEAEEATRFMKRQLVLVLRQNVPIVEALWMMAKDHPGEFGVTFRKYLSQIEDGKPLRHAMREFREEYEIRPLTDMCLAIELSDLKSPDRLADQLYTQTIDENARVEEFIERKENSSKTTMMLIVGLAFVWTLLVCFVFAYYGFVDYFRGRGGFLF